MRFLLIIVGLACGVVSGMGMGGGTLLIPALTLFFNLSQPMAQGVNLLVFIPMSIVVGVINIKRKMVDKKCLLLIIPPALITSVAFSFLIKSINGATLKKCYGAFLLAAGLAFIIITVINQCKNRGNSKPEK